MWGVALMLRHVLSYLSPTLWGSIASTKLAKKWGRCHLTCLPYSTCQSYVLATTTLWMVRFFKVGKREAV
jgi:hypothetical protein